MKAPLAISAVLCILLTLVGQKAAGMMPPPAFRDPKVTCCRISPKHSRNENRGSCLEEPVGLVCRNGRGSDGFEADGEAGSGKSRLDGRAVMRDR